MHNISIRLHLAFVRVPVRIDGMNTTHEPTDQEYLYCGLRQSVYDQQSLHAALVKELDLPQIERVTVEREAIDARRKPSVVAVYNLRFTVRSPGPRLNALLAAGTVEPYLATVLPEPERHLRLPERPVIVGFGPAGMFLGLELARLGYRPIIFERGEAVPQRVRSVQRLWQEGELNPDSNLQFGAGGAGTFSDGKLTTGKRRPLNDAVLQTFVAAGAPERILSQGKPHIGTDYLRRVVRWMQEQIEALGGEVHFGHTLTDLQLDQNGVRTITVNGQRQPCSCLILAIGHSARDTLAMLYERQVAMELKPFAVGVRIEHPAAFINEAQYGVKAAAVLPAADYKVTCKHEGKPVYSFCMCPGGQVVCAASESGGLVVNGMSFSSRQAKYSNSALVVSVNPADYHFRSPLEAVQFQRQFEARAFAAGGGKFVAPAQRARDFLNAVTGTLPPTSYQPDVKPADLNEVLPPAILPALKVGLQHFDRRMRGFVDKGVLIGFESRTSSPVRLLRDETYCSVSTEGLYLLGEGAGYAGGIMTCALDALRFARQVLPWGEQ